MELMRKDTIHHYLQVLGIDVHDVDRFFGMIDKDQKGEIQLPEFLAAMFRLQGEARGADLALLHKDFQLIMVHWNKFMSYIVHHNAQVAEALECPALAEQVYDDGGVIA